MSASRACGGFLRVLTRKVKSGDSFAVNLQSRHYARNFRRDPVAILSADDEKHHYIKTNVKFRDRITDFDRDDPVLQNLPQTKDFDRAKSIPRIQRPAVNMTGDGQTSRSKRTTIDINDQKIKQKSKIKKMTSNNPAEREEGQYNGITYTVLRDVDKKLGAVLRSARSKKSREKDGNILLEGSRLICDALRAGASLKSVFFEDFEVLSRLPPPQLEDVPVYKCTKRHMNIWSDTTTPPGIMAVFHLPEDGEAIYKPSTTIPLTVILDQIRDPGNMGTLIRSAAAVGCQQFIAMKRCVDIWEPKVLRSGAGCHFRVPIHRGVTWDRVENYLPTNSAIYLADKRRPTEKRMTKYLSAAPEDVFNMVSENREDGYASDSESDHFVNKSFNDEEELRKYQHVPLTMCGYSEENYARKDHVVLVIGGEIHGVGLEARKLAFDRYGKCVMIPMTDGTESLNAAVAGSVLMFEIYKQLGHSVLLEPDLDSVSEEKSSDISDSEKINSLPDEKVI